MNIRRILSLALAVIICAVSFASCGNKADTNTLEADIYETIDNILSTLDFGEAILTTDKNDDDNFVLMYQYGVGEDDETVLEAIDGYAITSPETNSAKTVAIIKFKEGTDASVIEKVEESIRSVFLANLIEITATYDVDQAMIADCATFRAYDNALVLAAYDTEGNTQVFDLIK